MKKLMFANLAFALAALGTGQAVGQQFVPNQASFGPSSYPVQTPPSGFANQMPQVPSLYGASLNSQQMLNSQPTHQQASVQSLPFAQFQQTAAYATIPAFNQPLYQLTSAQDVYGQQPSHAPALGGVQPLPDPSAHSTNNLVVPQVPGPMHSYGAPVDHSYQQHLAPGCSSCGPAPVSQFGHMGFDQCACASPLAYNAPGLSSGFPMGGFGHSLGFGGRHHSTIGGLPAGAKPWFFGGGALIFHRRDGKNVPLSLRDADNRDVLSTRDARMDTMGGFQLMGGRYFNCGQNAVQATFWGLYPDTETARVVAAPAGGYRSRALRVGDADITHDPTGANIGIYDVYDWYDDAAVHYLTRSSEYYNVEVNLLGFGAGGAARNFNRATAGTLLSGSRHGRGCGYCGGAGCGACGGAAYGACGPNACYAPCQPTRFATGPTGYIAPACGNRLNLTWLAGVRYFRFEDELQYAADFNGDGLTRAVDDLYYDVNVTNDLIGFQWGGRGDYCIGRRWNVFASGKVGVYNNHSTLYSRIGTETVTATEAGMPTMPYMVDVSDNDVAFISDLGTGFGVCLSPKWTATFGYTAVVASGVATSPGNVRKPGDFLRDQRYINNDDVLVLHGINVGANYNF